ncbi:MAG: lysophospholipid acyltransferase family protein [Bacteroidia bacterium]
MKVLSTPLMLIWKVWFILLFLVSYALLFPFFWFFLGNKKYSAQAIATTRIWAYTVMFGVGILLKIKKDKNFKISEPYIICCNHTSYLDIVLLHIFLGNKIVFMGKKELGSTPIIKRFFKHVHILVDRKSQIASHRAFLKASQEIDNGKSIIIFPEGTISREKPLLKPFKNGAFRMAIDKNVKILPITFLNNWQLLEDAPLLKGKGSPGFARIVIHKPINPNDFKGEFALEEIKNKVRFEIANELSKYYHKKID